MSSQKQLNPTYHDNKFLCDRLSIAVSIPSVQVSLGGRVPGTAQQPANRTANRLSSKQQISVASTIHYDPTSFESLDDGVMYTFVQSYGGAVTRPIKPYESKGSNVSRCIPRPEPGKEKYRCVNPPRTQDVKGCFLFGGTYLAQRRHTKTEIKLSIVKLKAQQPAGLQTVEDLATMLDITRLH